TAPSQAFGQLRHELLGGAGDLLELGVVIGQLSPSFVPSSAPVGQISLQRGVRTPGIRSRRPMRPRSVTGSSSGAPSPSASSTSPMDRSRAYRLVSRASGPTRLTR